MNRLENHRTVSQAFGEYEEHIFLTKVLIDQVRRFPSAESAVSNPTVRELCVGAFSAGQEAAANMGIPATETYEQFMEWLLNTVKPSEPSTSIANLL